MSIDLSFTADPAWVDRRQAAWDAIEDVVSEDLPKKKLEVLKKCFFEGNLPKKRPFAEGVFLPYFPDTSFAGLSYFCREFIDEKKIKSRDFLRVELNFSLNIHNWPGTDIGDRIRLFKMMHGEVHDPDRRFPFLIGTETEHRSFIYDTDDLFSVLTYMIRGGLVVQETDEYVLFLESTLLDYYISMFPYVSPWMFSITLDEEQAGISVGGLAAKGFSDGLKKILSMVAHPPEEVTDGPSPEIKLRCIDRLQRYLDSAESPAELVELWEWAKKEYAHE